MGCQMKQRCATWVEGPKQRPQSYDTDTDRAETGRVDDVDGETSTRVGHIATPVNAKISLSLTKANYRMKMSLPISGKSQGPQL